MNAEETIKKIDDISRRENILNGREALKARGMSEELAPLLDYTNPETMEKSMDLMKQSIDEGVKASIEKNFGSADTSTSGSTSEQEQTEYYTKVIREAVERGLYG